MKEKEGWRRQEDNEKKKKEEEEQSIATLIGGRGLC